MKNTVYLLLSLFLITCRTDDGTSSISPIEAEDFSEQNEMEIIEYLTDNELVAKKSDTGLHYIIENQGDGVQPIADSNVTVLYKGYYLDGTVFDENTEEGFTSDLNKLIPGWIEGIPLFNEGGNGILLIPAHLAYGSFNYNGIPGGSVIIFEIELVSVN